MRRSTPEITVLVPCRNPPPLFLPAALRSVLTQTSPHWRLLIIEDREHSSVLRDAIDSTGAAEDSRVAVIQSESRWVTGALNTGMRHAATPWVCTLHCDDLLEPTAIATLADAIERYEDAEFFHSARRFIDARGQPLGAIRSPRADFTAADFVRSLPVHRINCWKVERALAIGGMDESLGPHGADDYDFTWSLAEAGCRFQALPECLYVIRDHREHFRLTTHVPLDRQIAELRKIFRKHGVSEAQTEAEVTRRREGYLRQAIYLDEADRKAKLATGFDPRTGWRLRY